jgi:hypothetical protein
MKPKSQPYGKAKADVQAAAARQRERRRAIARLPIGEKFKILEQLHDAQREIAAIRAAARARGVENTGE